MKSNKAQNKLDELLLLLFSQKNKKGKVGSRGFGKSPKVLNFTKKQPTI
jgi:hypothetical protein